MWQKKKQPSRAEQENRLESLFTFMFAIDFCVQSLHNHVKVESVQNMRQQQQQEHTITFLLHFVHSVPFRSISFSFSFLLHTHWRDRYSDFSLNSSERAVCVCAAEEMLSF